MKTKTIFIVTIVAIIIILGLAFYAKKKKDQAVAKTDDTKSDVSKSSSKNLDLKIDYTTTECAMPIKQGSRGKQVYLLQRVLNDRYKAGLIADGIWGARTQAAVLARKLPTEMYYKDLNEMMGG